MLFMLFKKQRQTCQDGAVPVTRRRPPADGSSRAAMSLHAVQVRLGQWWNDTDRLVVLPKRPLNQIGVLPEVYYRGHPAKPELTVAALDSRGAGHAAGLAVGDIILTIDGRTMRDKKSIEAMMKSLDDAIQRAGTSEVDPRESDLIECCVVRPGAHRWGTVLLIIAGFAWVAYMLVRRELRGLRRQPHDEL